MGVVGGKKIIIIKVKFGSRDRIRLDKSKLKFEFVSRGPEFCEGVCNRRVQKQITASGHQ